MKETGKMLKEKKVKQKKGTEQKHRNEGVFRLDFLVVLSEEREELIQKIKNSEKIKRILSHTKMFLKPREQKQKTKESFHQISPQKNTFLFLDTSTGRKKRNRVEKKNQNKASYKNEKPFFQDTEKEQNMEKHVKKAQQKKRKQRKRSFFLR